MRKGSNFLLTLFAQRYIFGQRYNMCTRYIGTKCYSQKVALSSLKKINWRKHTPLYEKDTKLNQKSSMETI